MAKKHIKRDRETVLKMFRSEIAEKAMKAVTELVSEAERAGYLQTNTSVVVKDIGNKVSRTILNHWKQSPPEEVASPFGVMEATS